MATRQLDFRRAQADLFPIRVSYYDRGLPVWSDELAAPGVLEAPVFEPGAVQSIRIEYGDGTFVDEVVDARPRLGRRAIVLGVLAFAVGVVLGVAALWFLLRR